MKKVSNSDVTVVIAALNEEKGIGPTLRELREASEDPCFLVQLVLVLERLLK
jgi:glycosyltransferase involved in cell wall biosynthesis